VLSNPNRPDSNLSSNASRPAERHSTRGSALRGRRLLFESLEARQLLAGDLAARFEFANAAGNVVSSLSVGQDFELRLYVQDIRAVPTRGLSSLFRRVLSGQPGHRNGAVVHGPNFAAPERLRETRCSPG
jgi:hypothetical protein